MTETPDFEKIADYLVEDLALPAPELLGVLIAEQLRLVWNARGAADLVTLESELTSMIGGTASGPYAKNLDCALRSLDR